MNVHKPKLYLAAPLFSRAELDFNQSLVEVISHLFDIFLPQRDGGLMDEMIHRGVPIEIASQHVFNIDIKAIREAELLLAILDGRTVDEGVAVEIGYAYALEKRCFALQTTPIRLLPSGNNPMITNVLEDTFSSVDSLTRWAESYCSDNHFVADDISKTRRTQ